MSLIGRASDLDGIGALRARMGHDASEVLVEFEAALLLDPRVRGGYEALGDTLAALGRTGDAREAFQLCLDSEPEKVHCAERLRTVNVLAPP